MRYYKAIILGAFIIAVLVVFFRRYQPALDNSPASDQAAAINLSNFTNVKLTDNLNSPSSLKQNNLADFPAGKQTLANVPFDISGIVQVTGKRIQEWGLNDFPAAVRDIPIHRSCRRLFLLHGAGGVADPQSTVIAKLVLHYSDKTSRSIEIKLADHVRDWWGEPVEPVLSKGSELAWSGSNPVIKQLGGGGMLRIYKSTFANPRPGVSIETIDYVSTLRNTSSFMLGLTLD